MDGHRHQNRRNNQPSCARRSSIPKELFRRRGLIRHKYLWQQARGAKLFALSLEQHRNSRSFTAVLQNVDDILGEPHCVSARPAAAQKRYLGLIPSFNVADGWRVTVTRSRSPGARNLVLFSVIGVSSAWYNTADVSREYTQGAG
jgi:hypothetical protein